MDWWYGGLQYQIEHHLFPRAPRHNLRKIVNRVRPFCKKHGVPYMSVSFIVRTMWKPCEHDSIQFEFSP